MADFDLDRFLADDPGGPVVMLNLLRFRPGGGRERYDEYAAAAAGRGLPAEPSSCTSARATRCAGRRRHGTRWRSCATRAGEAFADMVRSPEYRAIEHLRTEALVDAALQPTLADVSERRTQAERRAEAERRLLDAAMELVAERRRARGHARGDGRARPATAAGS